MVNRKFQVPYGDDISGDRYQVQAGTNTPDTQTRDIGKPLERGQAVALFALLLPIMAVFAVLIMEYMITTARTMSAVAAADLAAHAGAQEITLDPDGTIQATELGQQVAASYFQAQKLEFVALSHIQCGRFQDRPACRVAVQVQTPGFLLPKKWIPINAIGYLAHGITRGDQ